MTAAIVLIVVAALLILLIAVMAIRSRVSGITNRESNGWMEAA